MVVVTKPKSRTSGHPRDPGVSGVKNPGPQTGPSRVRRVFWVGQKRPHKGPALA